MARVLTESQKEERYGPVVIEVTSKHEPDRIYQVRQHHETRAYSCNCTGWAFRKVCKHVIAAQGAEGLKPGEAGLVPGLGVVRPPTPVAQQPKRRTPSKEQAQFAASIVAEMAAVGLCAAGTSERGRAARLVAGLMVDRGFYPDGKAPINAAQTGVSSALGVRRIVLD